MISEDLGLQLEKVELSSLGRAKKVTPSRPLPARAWQMGGVL